MVERRKTVVNEEQKGQTLLFSAAGQEPKGKSREAGDFLANLLRMWSGEE